MYDADHTSVRTADRVKMDGYEISWNRDSELTKPSGWRTTDDGRRAAFWRRTLGKSFLMDPALTKMSCCPPLWDAFDLFSILSGEKSRPSGTDRRTSSKQ